jgi:steroid delta-isomerase-like uncharacterized protein
MPGQNSAIVRRFVEDFQTKHDVSVAEELISDDFTDGSPFPGMSPDKNGTMAFHAMMFAAFPDLSVEIHEQVEEGEKVVTRKTFHGTHDGEFMGIPASGAAIAFNVIDIITVRQGGKIVEHRNVFDALSLMQQIGAIPNEG